jgi:hypothetical protein
MSTAPPVNQPPAYPVAFDVEPQLHGRNRLTVAFRIILAIPHLILVGGPGLALGSGLGIGFRNGRYGFASFSGHGALGAVAFVMAMIAWFAILFANQHPRGLWDFARFFMRWRTRAIVYTAMLRDEYPPFGDAPYPVTYEVEFPDAPRKKWSVGLRIIYVIPHAIVLFFLGIVFCLVQLIVWFAILFTGSFPQGLYQFCIGYLRWSVRVETYMLLMRDEYPPFSFQP